MKHFQAELVSRREVLRGAAVAPFVLAGSRASFGAEYDLVIRGGRVIDPSLQIDRMADVAIRGGKIAAIGTKLAGPNVLDASGKLVMPGLIDIHTHVADAGLTPEQLLATGVTSLVDGGSRGAANVDNLVKIAEAAPNRVRILLNISRRGLEDGADELMDITKADPMAARAAIGRSRAWIIGLKCRLSRSAAANNDLEALRRARQVADALKVPIMIHMGDTASPLPDLLALLHVGDIVTHMYAPPPHGIMDDSGNILPQVLEARKRGVRFDFGNGRSAHWTWDVATQALKQGFLPDTLSSDITADGMKGQVVNLPHVMSKFLLMGLSMNQVIASVTMNAARSIAPFREYGTLRRGAVADVAVLELQKGDVEFVDNYGGKRTGHEKLAPFAVVAGGKRIG